MMKRLKLPKHRSVIGQAYIGNDRWVPLRFVDYDELGTSGTELHVLFDGDPETYRGAPKLLVVRKRIFALEAWDPRTSRLRYREHQPGTSLIDEVMKTAVEYTAVPFQIAQGLGVHGTLYCVHGAPQRRGGSLPHRLRDPHEGKLEVFGYDPSRRLTLYLNVSLNVAWREPSPEQLRDLPLTGPSANEQHRLFA